MPIQEKSSTNYEQSTPWEVFNEQTKGYRILLDACASCANTKAAHWYDINCDGLKQDWAADLIRLQQHAQMINAIDGMLWTGIKPLEGKAAIWMNPPYGREIPKWIKKAIQEALKGATIICLLPARPGSVWFGWLWNYKTNRPRRWVKEWRYLPGRIHFNDQRLGAKFPSMVLILKR